MECWGSFDGSEDQRTYQKESILPLKRLDVEPPTLFQPSPPKIAERHDVKFSLDGVTQHTIQLLQYAARMRSLIQHVRQQLQELQKSGEPRDKYEFPLAPVVPTCTMKQPASVQNMPKPILPVKRRCYDSDSDFCRGFGKAPPVIDRITNRKLLIKSVTALTAHGGYEGSTQSALETLADVTHDFLSQMTQLLRRAVDEEAESGDTGYPDVMERVFSEMGLGDTSSVHVFYQQRVLLYNRHVLDTCRRLQNEYELMKNPNFNPNNASSSNNQEESLADLGLTLMDDETPIDESGNFEGLYGAGLSVGAAEDEVVWPQHSVPSTQSRHMVEHDEDQPSVGSLTAAHTPAMLSEAGESLQHSPASVSALMSPPSALPPPRSALAAGTPQSSRKRKR